MEGAGDLVQQLGELAALAEDTVVSNTHIVAHNYPWLQSQGIQCPILASVGTRKNEVHRHTCKIFTHIKYKSNL